MLHDADRYLPPPAPPKWGGQENLGGGNWGGQIFGILGGAVGGANFVGFGGGSGGGRNFSLAYGGGKWGGQIFWVLGGNLGGRNQGSLE